jgi:hypothetical protein
MFREDVQDDGGPVQHLHVQHLFQISLLGGGQFVIRDDGVKVEVTLMVFHFPDLALAQIGVGLRFRKRLHDSVDYLDPGRIGEASEFSYRFLGGPGAVVDIGRE